MGCGVKHCPVEIFTMIPKRWHQTELDVYLSVCDTLLNFNSRGEKPESILYKSQLASKPSVTAPYILPKKISEVNPVEIKAIKITQIPFLFITTKYE